MIWGLYRDSTLNPKQGLCREQIPLCSLPCEPPVSGSWSDWRATLGSGSVLEGNFRGMGPQAFWGPLRLQIGFFVGI